MNGEVLDSQTTKTLVVQHFPQATRHLAEEVFASLAHRKARRLLSISAIVVGGTQRADMA